MNIDIAFLIVTVIMGLTVVYAIGCVVKTIVCEIGYYIAKREEDKAMLEYYVNN